MQKNGTGRGKNVSFLSKLLNPDPPDRQTGAGITAVYRSDSQGNAPAARSRAEKTVIIAKLF